MSARKLWGPPGYFQLLEAISDPKDEERDFYASWVGTSFSAEEFTVVAANVALQKIR